MIKDRNKNVNRSLVRYEIQKHKRRHFLSRLNRFIANIEIDGKPEMCHVKNIGRHKELLIPGTKVYV